MKRTRKKKNRGLVTQVIVYRDTRYAGGRPHELTVDVRRGEVVDVDYLAATVAVRTGVPLGEVQIIEVRAP